MQATKEALIRSGNGGWATSRPGPPATKDVSTPTPLPIRAGVAPTPYQPFHTPLPGRGVLIERPPAGLPSATFLAVNAWVLETNNQAATVLERRAASAVKSSSKDALPVFKSDKPVLKDVLSVLPAALTRLEQVIETFQRLEGFQTEVEAMVRLGISHRDWLALPEQASGEVLEPLVTILAPEAVES